MIKQQLAEIIKSALQELGVTNLPVQVSRPDNPAHGDYTTQVAFAAAKQLGKSPVEIANEIVKNVKCQMPNAKFEEVNHYIKQSGQKRSEKLTKFSVLQDIEKIEAAGAGFINFFLTASKLGRVLDQVITDKESFGKAQNQILNIKYQKSRRVMVEFAHPNTHKAFHIGHLRNISTGECIVRLLESQGVEVIRANYQGDVGMHIAKCLYGILKMSNAKLQMINKKLLIEKIELLSQAYVAGNKAYEEDPKAKEEILKINKEIYTGLSHAVRLGGSASQRPKTPKQVRDYSGNVIEIYRLTRQWSLEYFENIYKRVGTRFDRYYFESEVALSGKEIVQKALENNIFEKSDGAIIFRGEKHGLHNRVFITSEGNPAYEAKDIGLAKLQFDEYDPDLIIHVVGPEQSGYFQVLFKALEYVFPKTAGREKHLIYGWVKLKQGKMSSRSGNVVLGEWLLDQAKEEIKKIIQISKHNDQNSKSVNTSKDKEEIENIAEKAAVAAVKYSFLRVSLKSEIAFDIGESVNFEGDSGPYLLYTYARARSVLRKNAELNDQNSTRNSSYFDIKNDVLNTEERKVLQLLNYYPEIVAEAAKDCSPSTLCNYLFDLAQAFNLFYAKHSILGKKREVKSEKQKNLSLITYRLSLTQAVAQVLKNGLYLLGIETVEKM